MFHGLMDLVEMLPAAEYAVMGHFCRILLVLEVLCPGTLSKNTKTSDTKKMEAARKSTSGEKFQAERVNEARFVPFIFCTKVMQSISGDTFQLWWNIVSHCKRPT